MTYFAAGGGRRQPPILHPPLDRVVVER